MSVNPVSTIDQSFLEVAGAIERYAHGGSVQELLKISRKNMDGLGRLLSMQCVQASSARYMASLGKEFALHNKRLNELFERLADPKVDMKRLVHDLDAEFKEFREFLVGNGFVSKNDLDLARKMEDALKQGKKKKVFAYLLEKVPRELPGLKALIKSTRASASLDPEARDPGLLGVVSYIPHIIGALIIVTSAMTVLLLRCGATVEAMPTITLNLSPEASVLLMFGGFAVALVKTMLFLDKNYG